MKITNFRSIGGTIEIAVPSRNLALVGSNNAGKSNIVAGLDWVLGSRTPWALHAERDDFFDPNSPIVIKATIGDIIESDKRTLMPIATKKQQGALSKKTDASITLVLTVPPLEGDLDEDADTSEADEPSATKPKLDIDLWGFAVYRKTVDCRRKLIQTVRVATQRTVEDDLKASQWTPYGQLMKAVLESSSQYDELRTLLGDVNQKIQEAFTEQKDSLVAGARVVSYVDDIDFQLTRENNPSELLRYLEVPVTEDGLKMNLNRLGTGTQSAVIIGILELVLRARTSTIKLLLIEEPDAFIHPHGVRHFAGLVRRIADEPTSQIVLTTHSPSLLATLPPSDIVRVEKKDGKTIVFQSPGTLADPVFARYVDRDTAEMVFARRVILVEGDTERFLLPPLSPMVGKGRKSCDFDIGQISVVVMHTKDNIVNFLRILDEFSIETRAVLDNDFLNGSSCRALVKYLRSKGNEIDDSDDTKLRQSLWQAGILVLKKGEIENYIPESDVAALTGQPVNAVQLEIKSAKTSEAFKKLFGSPKPIYARQIAEHYVASGKVPADLEKLIRQLTE